MMARLDLPESSILAIQPTIPSPLQYGYRTKITPHFDPPPKKARKQSPSASEEGKPSWLKIGFNQTGKRVVMDIEVWHMSRKYDQVVNAVSIGMPHCHPGLE